MVSCPRSSWSILLSGISIALLFPPLSRCVRSIWPFSKHNKWSLRFTVVHDEINGNNRILLNTFDFQVSDPADKRIKDAKIFLKGKGQELYKRAKRSSNVLCVIHLLPMGARLECIYKPTYTPKCCTKLTPPCMALTCPHSCNYPHVNINISLALFPVALSCCRSDQRFFWVRLSSPIFHMQSIPCCVDAFAKSLASVLHPC